MSTFQEKPFVIHPYKGGKGLAEIYQSMALKIALAEKDAKGTYLLAEKKRKPSFTVKTPGVLCRDFLSDVYTSSVQKYNFGIYGMKWDGTKDVPDWSGLYLHLTFPNVAAKANLDKNAAILHEIEDKNKIPRTQFFNIGEKSGFAIADKAWLANSLLISLYTLLLRIFCHEFKTNDWIKEFGGQNHTDSQYIKNFPRKSLDKILNDLKSIHTKDFCGFDFKKDGTSSVHHNSGIVSIFSTHREISYATVKKNKHWQEMKKRGFELYTK